MSWEGDREWKGERQRGRERERERRKGEGKLYGVYTINIHLLQHFFKSPSLTNYPLHTHIHVHTLSPRSSCCVPIWRKVSCWRGWKLCRPGTALLLKDTLFTKIESSYIHVHVYKYWNWRGRERKRVHVCVCERVKERGERLVPRWGVVEDKPGMG